MFVKQSLIESWTLAQRLKKLACALQKGDPSDAMGRIVRVESAAFIWLNRSPGFNQRFLNSGAQRGIRKP